VKRTAISMKAINQHERTGPVARLNRDGLIEPLAVDESLTDLLFAGRRDPLDRLAAAASMAERAPVVEQSALFELV
jgi:hypothetical protein